MLYQKQPNNSNDFISQPARLHETLFNRKLFCFGPAPVIHNTIYLQYIWIKMLSVWFFIGETLTQNGWINKKSERIFLS